ncbi:CBS domain-containing protein [Aliiglaciecola litoralis]|uniref:CBS domain-containing protein n=1 Tax=Aliiglaciecola litoralis TaxID=582857 RepID=A0ABN1LMM9_9ALTE
MPLQAAQIMTSRLIKLTPEASLHDAHEITREKGIRHLPVVNQHTHQLIGIVTQKDLIANVIRSIALYGTEELLEREKQTSIMEIVRCDFASVKKNDELRDIVPYFLDNKHGCLPVVDDNQCIIGIITSSDFVKLSMQLLDQTENSN